MLTTRLRHNLAIRRHSSKSTEGLDSHVACWAAQNGNQLRCLDNHHARALPGHDAQDLRQNPNSRDKGLHHERQPRAKLFRDPSCDEEIEGSCGILSANASLWPERAWCERRTAKGRAHAQNAKLRCRARGNLIPAAPVSRPLIRRVSVVEDVAFHEMKHVKEPMVQRQLPCVLVARNSCSHSRHLGITERQRNQKASKQNSILHMKHSLQPGLGLGGDAIAASLPRKQRRCLGGRRHGHGWQVDIQAENGRTTDGNALTEGA